MNSDRWTSNNDDFSSHAYSGNNSRHSPSAGNRNRSRPNGTSNSRYPPRGYPPRNPRTGGYSNHLASQLKAKDDEANAYVVNLQLDPINMGITAKNGQWEKTFQGIGAFSHYFGLCAPTKGLGYTLPDVWDGYFHITLAKFFSRLSHEQLKETFKQFNPSLEDVPYIPNVVFRCSKIETHPGKDRGPKLSDIDFVVLSIEKSNEIEIFHEKIKSLLAKIEEKADATDWYVTPVNRLHVTIRKYSNFPEADLNQIKTQEFPLEFRCSHLEVKQPRQKATNINKRTKTYIWWSGVTEGEDHKCTECNAPVMSEVWEGFCLACGKYETMIPFWSTVGTNNQNHSTMQEQE